MMVVMAVIVVVVVMDLCHRGDGDGGEGSFDGGLGGGL